MIDPIGISAALAARNGMADETRQARAIAPVANAGSFADMIIQAGASAVQKLEGAEATAIRGIQGDVGPRQVAEAVMDAEQTLNAAIAIRDKIVSAYLEISRMSI